MSGQPTADTAVRELVEKIQQFLSHQVETSAELSEAAKESLTVASECIEQAYRIQRRPASGELLDIYTNSRNNNNQQGAGGVTNPAAFIQNLASSIISSASASVSSSATPSDTTSSSTTQQQQQQQQQPQPQPQPPQPRVRKNATDAEKMAAESFKNQGNDFMKQDKYKEAYDCYTRAIEIDDNNAIYYSNRAAASSKLGDHMAALRDCQESVLIDSSYSKAYGRMGLAYASLGDHQKAKEAYVKAVELDPHNESYRNNLKIAEEKLAGGEGANGGANQTNNMMSIFRSMMSNPEVMSMAMRSIQDPRMQSLFGLGGGQTPATGDQANTNGQQQQQQPTPQAPSQQAQPEATQTSAPQTNSSSAQAGAATPQAPPVNPADLFNLTSRLAGSAGNIDFVGAGQQLLSTIEQNNPDLVNNMRRMMNQAFMPPQNNQNNSDRNPPPGYS